MFKQKKKENIIVISLLLAVLTIDALAAGNILFDSDTYVIYWYIIWKKKMCNYLPIFIFSSKL